MRIFLIGGAGYIGSHVLKALNVLGHDLITIDNLSTGHRDAVLFGKFELCDLMDEEALIKLFKKYKPEIVMHFGALSVVSDSVKDPDLYYRNNVIGTINLLHAMINNNCKKIIFSSTASIYGIPKYLPIDEEHDTDPINPYGRSKLMIEQMMEDYSKAYGLNYVSFRYFNAAGHDPEGELRERHNPETHLIPLIMKAANKEIKFIKIYGTDYPTKDGTCIRDFIHVCDLATAHIAAIDYLDMYKKNNIFNLGNEIGFTVKEVIDVAKRITGKEIPTINSERREGDPSVLVASSKKAITELGLIIKFSKIDDIIRTIKD